MPPAATLTSAARPRFLPAGDSALVVEFGSAIAPEANARVMRLDRELAAHPPAGLVETVPTYRSLMVVYDPLATDPAALHGAIDAALARCEAPTAEADPAATGRRWVIPTLYGGALGEDLADMAAYAGISEDEVVRLHSGAVYRVYMIGFTPGHAYLGGLPAKLHRPRRATPRPPVRIGSVVLGGQQTAVTTIPSPTGWYVLGHTPVRSFAIEHGDRAFLFRPGDIVRFERVAAQDHAALVARAAAGEPVARLEAAR